MDNQWVASIWDKADDEGALMLAVFQKQNGLLSRPKTWMAKTRYHPGSPDYTSVSHYIIFITFINYYIITRYEVFFMGKLQTWVALWSFYTETSDLGIA